MKWDRIRFFAYYLLTAGFGVLLHFLYDWSPNVIFALISPVQESVWEHTKLIYWPLLIFGLIYTRKDRSKRGNWYLAVLVASALVLIFGWVVNVRMGLISTPVDIAAYFIILLLGFAVARWMDVKGSSEGLLLFGVVILGIFIVAFSFLAPEGRLFADLSLADALYLLPW